MSASLVLGLLIRMKIVTREYNIDYVKTLENNKIIKNDLSYILFKGRTLKTHK